MKLSKPNVMGLTETEQDKIIDEYNLLVNSKLTVLYKRKQKIDNVFKMVKRFFCYTLLNVMCYLIVTFLLSIYFYCILYFLTHILFNLLNKLFI